MICTLLALSTAVIICATAGHAAGALNVEVRRDYQTCWPEPSACDEIRPSHDLDAYLQSWDNATGGRYSPGTYDMESVVRQLAEVSLENLLQFKIDKLNCTIAEYKNMTASCQKIYESNNERLGNQLIFYNRFQQTQLSNLQTIQQCLTYDLAVKMVCCFMKEYFSSSCSAEDTISCMKQHIRNACAASAVDAFDGVMVEYGMWARDDRYFYIPVVPFCPTLH